MIGAEGSGQTYAENEGLGPEVRHGLDTYADQLGAGYHVGYFSVPYPSTTYNVLFSPLKKSRQLFFDSIDSGVVETLNFLKAREPLCRDTGEQYVLAGYSQGAMVMHRVLWQLAQARTKSAEFASHVLPRVVGVLAIADGDKVAYQGGREYSTAPSSGSGIWWAGVAAANAKFKPENQPLPTLPGWDPGRFHSVCEAGDVVCDFGNTNPSGGAIHGGAYKKDGSSASATWTATGRIADDTRRIKPLPVDPGTGEGGSIPVRVGQHGVVVLAEDGLDVAAVSWLTDPIPGATLSAGEPTISATLDFVPMSAGTYPFSVRTQFTDGRVVDRQGAFVAYPVPEASLAIQNVMTGLQSDEFTLFSTVQFDVVKTLESSTTTPVHVTDNDPATDSYDYQSGDADGDGALDMGETWHYAGLVPWYDFAEPGNSRERILALYANDTTGAGAFRELYGPTVTLTR